MNTPFVFFGTSRFSVTLLEELKNTFSSSPSLIVTTPDRKVGRKQVLTSSPVKMWAEQNNIPVIQPEKLKDESFKEKLTPYSLFIVASYGKIIPKEILDIPLHGILNVHPSILPKYRGASPIQYQIMNDEKDIGTTIMLMDEDMDHGNIISQTRLTFSENEFPANYKTVEEKLAIISAALLAKIVPMWISKTISTTTQNHQDATYTNIIKKEDGEIKLSENQEEAYKNYLKYLAFSEWPKTFFFFEKDGKKLRAIIVDASFENGLFMIKKVIPEGKNEMSYTDFLNWIC